MDKDKLDNFIGEILEVCCKPKHSPDIIVKGLDFCLDFIKDKMAEARRENEREMAREMEREIANQLALENEE